MHYKALLLGATLWLSHCNSNHQQEIAKLSPDCTDKTTHSVPDTSSTLPLLALASSLAFLGYRRFAATR